jgi:hypothetical protein
MVLAIGIDLGVALMYTLEAPLSRYQDFHEHMLHIMTWRCAVGYPDHGSGYGLQQQSVRRPGTPDECVYCNTSQR